MELHLPPGTDASGLAPLVEVRPGQWLSRRSVRRTVERLFATGRFSDVVVRATPTEAGVALAFELTPALRVVKLTVAGNRVVTTQQLTSAARLSEGSEFYSERGDEIQRALAQVYALKGYRDAQVKLDVRPVSAQSVELSVTVWEGAPTRIGELNLTGAPGLSRRRVLEALGVGIGQVFDELQLEAGLERLRAVLRQERFYRARLGSLVVEMGAEGARLSLPLDAGPKFVFRFHGNRTFPDAAIAGVLHYDGAEPLDRSVEARMAQRIAQLYRYHGFMDVVVSPHEVLDGSGRRALLVFEINEGAAVEVRSLVFVGNHAAPSERLRRVLDETLLEKAPVPTGDVHANSDPLELEGRSETEPDGARVLDPSSVFVDEAYQEALERMAQLYRDRGFLSAAVTLRQVSVDERTHGASVVIDVSEGPQALVGTVELQGLPPSVTVRAPAGLQIGRPFRPAAVDQARAELLRSLGQQGYLFARVEADADVVDAGTRVRVRLSVDPGLRVRVGQVIIRGLVKTKEALVKANLRVHTGDVLDPDALLETQRQLVLLGIFKQVAVQLLNPDIPEPIKDVVVDCKERPRFSNELGVGYFLADGPRVVGSISMPNVLGRGIDLSFRGKVNYVGLSTLPLVTFQNPAELQGLGGLDFRGNVSLHQPRIYNVLPMQLGARLDLVGERVHRPSYLYQRFAAVAGLDWAARSWLNVSLQYEIENDFVNAGENALLTSLNLNNATDVQRLRFPQGRFVLQSVGPSASLDFRDDPANPSRGLLLAVTSEVTKDLGIVSEAQSIFTLKVAGNLSFYIPVAPRVVLALSLRGGRIFPFDHSETIAPKRFFLGGATTLRGFSEDGLVPDDLRQEYHRELDHCRTLVEPGGCTGAAQEVLGGHEVPSQGGTVYELAKAELRFPISHDFDLGIFSEAGNLWLDPKAFRPGALRYVVGGGIRYVTPIGPLALDVGFNLFPDTVLNEPVFQVQFSVGLF